MPEPFYAVAPTDVDSEHATIRSPLRPVAWWELSDAHFDFDSSILLPSMTEELAELVLAVRAHPDCPLAVFGHADPTGEIGYNKILSGRRALAVYGLLTRRADLWDHLFANPIGLDDWKKDDRAARMMQGHLTGTAPVPGKPTRPMGQLMPAYMEKIGVDAEGAAFKLPPTAFLGQGEDKDGKGAVQGCGESNPLLVLSKGETRLFDRPEQKEARDAANAPNRRVAVALFEKGTVVSPSKWPCPRAKEGIAGCRARFWSDAAERATPSEDRREFPADRTTFQCRFYDRLVASARRKPAMRPLVLRILNEEDKPDPNLDYTMMVEGEAIKGKTDGDGILRARIPTSARAASLVIYDRQVPIKIAKFPSVTQVSGVQIRLANLGYFAGEPDNQTSQALEDAIQAFQLDLRDEGRMVTVTRDPHDPALQAALLEKHGS